MTIYFDQFLAIDRALNRGLEAALRLQQERDEAVTERAEMVRQFQAAERDAQRFQEELEQAARSMMDLLRVFEPAHSSRVPRAAEVLAKVRALTAALDEAIDALRARGQAGTRSLADAVEIDPYAEACYDCADRLAALRTGGGEP
jgi:DNA repair exonuclease SbcCD ATPase subunit